LARLWLLVLLGFKGLSNLVSHGFQETNKGMGHGSFFAHFELTKSALGMRVENVPRIQLVALL
jgi:hypothetical protein